VNIPAGYPTGDLCCFYRYFIAEEGKEEKDTEKRIKCDIIEGGI